jgi:hypothetical protein
MRIRFKKYLILNFVVLIILFSGGCGNKQQQGGDIIEKAKMINILTDINLVEASLRSNQPRSAADSLRTIAFYNEIFKKYNTNRVQFDNSIRFYSKNPEVLGKIYDEVIARLSRMQSEENAKK